MKPFEVLRRMGDIVVPYIGTWIETCGCGRGNRVGMVVPYIGTWIETVIAEANAGAARGRTLYRYVD